MKTQEIDEYISKETEKSVIFLWKEKTKKEFTDEKSQYLFLIHNLHSSPSLVIKDLLRRNSLYGLNYRDLALEEDEYTEESFGEYY